MKKILTVFNATKAKQLLRDNLKIKALQRKEYIMVEDDRYDDALKILRKREMLMIKPEIRHSKDIIMNIEKWFETHSVLTKKSFRLIKEGIIDRI